MPSLDSVVEASCQSIVARAMPFFPVHNQSDISRSCIVIKSMSRKSRVACMANQGGDTLPSICGQMEADICGRQGELQEEGGEIDLGHQVVFCYGFTLGV